MAAIIQSFFGDAMFQLLNTSEREFKELIEKLA